MIVESQVELVSFAHQSLLLVTHDHAVIIVLDLLLRWLVRVSTFLERGSFDWTALR